MQLWFFFLRFGIELNFVTLRNAYPIFAQKGYRSPREVNGRIVCSNCHLAQKAVEIRIPQSVFPSTVVEVVVQVPYDESKKQYRQMVFPVLVPNPEVDARVTYLKYPVYVGRNRGRGQVYPDGSKSNNTVYRSSSKGVVSEIIFTKKGGFEVRIRTSRGNIVTEVIPSGPELLVSVGQSVEVDDPLTTNPNVGGFGQRETEVVLQNPRRVHGLLAFFIVVLVSQVFFVLKKKQFEKVQLAEINF